VGDTSLRDTVLDWIESELRRKGFEVRRNAVVEHEGFRHSIDLLGEMTLLHGIRLNVGFVIIEKRFSVEDLERLIAWRDLLGLCKVVAVLLAEAEGDVLGLASRKGIDIVVVDEATLSRIAASRSLELRHAIVRHIEPRHGIDEAVEEASRISRGIFRRARTRRIHTALVFLPLIVSRLEVSKRGEEGEEVEVVEGVLTIEGYRGFGVSSRGTGIDLLLDYGSFADLPPDSLTVLSELAESGSIDIDQLSRRLGIDSERARELLDELAKRGLVEVYGDTAELRGIEFESFAEPEAIARSVGAEVHDGFPEERSGRVVLDSRVSAEVVERLAEAMHGRVLSTKLVYYPLYAALIVEEKNGVVHERLVVLDGLDLERVESLEHVLSDPEVVELVKGRGAVKS